MADADTVAVLADVLSLMEKSYRVGESGIAHLEGKKWVIFLPVYHDDAIPL